MATPQENWSTALLSQIDFYNRANRRTRVDDDINWRWYYANMPLRRRVGLYLRPLLQVIHREKYRTLDFKPHWFKTNATSLWRARELFHDDLSRKEFDSFLLSAICGFERFYYSRLHFDDMMTITQEDDITTDLPKEYLGLPLRRFGLNIKDVVTPNITVVSAREEIEVTNKFKRYFTVRDGVSFAPKKDDVVFDCGSCVAEISMMLAAHVGPGGKVHLFDPIPLHHEYSKLQISLNPSLADVLVINQVGVSDTSRQSVGTISDVTSISPGGCSIDNFDLVSIDDFVKTNNLSRLDYIKMDIEGAELDALRGAAGALRQFKPKLAISCYHQGSHLWEIPELIKKINPDYKIYFEQHLPFECDALIYAY